MRIREAKLSDSAGMGRVQSEAWHSTYRGIVEESFLQTITPEAGDKRFQERLCGMVAKSCAYVAEDETGRVVAYAIGGPERSKQEDYDGELYAIYIEQAQQKKGIGGRLLRAVAERLHEEGLRSLLVWVLADNPSRAFYEKNGGQFVRSQQIQLGSQSLEEVAYGWTSLAQLL